ncbi:uncharacterized protein TRAVEDRAFT_46572 [Trametes versicolor FP-101664 SS1]|uniref:uncharacterized protein n=1 Tax=Trametes versicolor (strain FP-101664) TaxID=717944 RepID=UPI0004622368|nr:uncharacterized protein TRAVEDRAFT_46572 [Trametes versicolor FP-101664 SS1]EIW59264.1 hypothetical protein TRAVEDRAFT_46572 [Trametes versicolor FP-101664 SS1]
MSQTALQRLPLSVREDICRQLIEPGKNIHYIDLRIGCGTLAALARTCKLFHDPSLNVLWHSIPDIYVLFYSLPSTCYQIQVINDDRPQVHFREPVRQLDLTRFLANAQRVQAIKNSLCHLPEKTVRCKASPSVYEALASILQSRPLLPNIRVVEHHTFDSIYSHRLLRSIHVLFGPRLLTLDLAARARGRCSPNPDRPGFLDKVDWEDDIACMLSKVERLAPGLRNLDLFIDPSSCVIAAAVSSVICGLNHLTSVRLRSDRFPLTPAAFAHLASLPSLTTLEFSTDHTFLPDSDFNPLLHTTPLPFPALRDLKFTTPTLELLVRFLAFITSPYIVSLWVMVTVDVSRCEIPSLLSAIAAHPSCNSLQILYIDVNNVTLAPLWGLPLIRELRLDVHCPFDLDDALLRKIGLKWVKLKHLMLGTEHPWGMREGDAPVEDSPGNRNISATPTIIIGQDAAMEVEDEDADADEEEGNKEEGDDDEDEEESDEEDEDKDEDEDDEDDDEEADGEDEEEDHAMPPGWRRPRVTLTGLARFIAICPFLDFLGVEFDADASSIPPNEWTTPPMSDVLPPKGYVYSPFYICAGLSPIDDPYAVAAFLSNTLCKFSNVPVFFEPLKSVEPDENDEDDSEEEEWWSRARKYRTRWKKFTKLFPKFVAIRKQERRWRLRTRRAAHDNALQHISDLQLGLVAEPDE